MTTPQEAQDAKSAAPSTTTPACPVSRCVTKTPHTNDPTVQAFMRQSPADVIDWTKRCIVELIQSVIDDVNNGLIFAYLTRWRDPEELYIRVLYALFVAPSDHHPHIFSGDWPNGFSAMWKKVNEVVFEGNGTLFKEQVGLSGEVFTTMDTLNQNAHNSFSTMLTTVSTARSKPEEWQPRIKKHVEHWQRYVEYLNHVRGARKKTLFRRSSTCTARLRDGKRSLVSNRRTQWFQSSF